jgi:predicted nuclease with TOPRIM domain
MKLGNEIIKNKFDDIDIKVDFLIELCQMLQVENLELNSNIKDLETKLAKKNETEELNLEQEALIQSKIDGLLAKLDSFSSHLSNDASKKDHQSNV